MACSRCPLSQSRRRIVKGRGTTPCRVLFIGEAPGKSEDLRGVAFIGRAGRLLDRGIAAAVRIAGIQVAPPYWITNVCCCRPTDEKGGNREPTPEEAASCLPRLEKEFVEVGSPREVVFLGEVSRRFARKLFPAGTALRHPAFILRRGGAESSEFFAFVRDLSEVFIRATPPVRRLRRMLCG